MELYVPQEVVTMNRCTVFSFKYMFKTRVLNTYFRETLEMDVSYLEKRAGLGL